MRSFNSPGDLLIESLHTKSLPIHLKQISVPLINFYWHIVWNGGEESIFGPSQIIAREETAVAWRLTAKQIEIKSSFRRTFFMESQSWTNQATHKPTIKLCGSLQGLIKFQISDGRSKQPIPFFSFVTFLLDSLFHPFGDRTVTLNPRLIYEHRSITKIPSCQSQWVVWVCGRERAASPPRADRDWWFELDVVRGSRRLCSGQVTNRDERVRSSTWINADLLLSLSHPLTVIAAQLR